MLPHHFKYTLSLHRPFYTILKMSRLFKLYYPKNDGVEAELRYLQGPRTSLNKGFKRTKAVS